jgi:hypothetical protein
VIEKTVGFWSVAMTFSERYGPSILDGKFYIWLKKIFNPFVTSSEYSYFGCCRCAESMGGADLLLRPIRARQHRLGWCSWATCGWSIFVAATNTTAATMSCGAAWWCDKFNFIPPTAVIKSFIRIGIGITNSGHSLLTSSNVSRFAKLFHRWQQLIMGRGPPITHKN